MSYWVSSALVKLYVQELDSSVFRALAIEASRMATGRLRGADRVSAAGRGTDRLMNASAIGRESIGSSDGSEVAGS